MPVAERARLSSSGVGITLSNPIARRNCSLYVLAHDKPSRGYPPVGPGPSRTPPHERPALRHRRARGRTLRLGTADRVLAFMGEAPIGPVFRREVEAFLAVTRTKVSVLGAHGARNPSFVARLRRGLSPSLETVDRVRAWMAAHSSPAEARAIRAAVAAQSSEPAGGDAP